MPDSLFVLKASGSSDERLPKPKMRRVRVDGKAAKANYSCPVCGRTCVRVFREGCDGFPCSSCGCVMVLHRRVAHKDFIDVPEGYAYDARGRLRPPSDRYVQIPVEMWGRDHWSTLAYIETRIVDYEGVPKPRHMRNTCHHGIPVPAMGLDEGEEYPTRLKGQGVRDFIKLYGHDDWSCCEDAVAEGLLIWNGTGINPVFELTELGRDACAKLRAFKSDGGMFHYFEWRKPGV